MENGVKHSLSRGANHELDRGITDRHNRICTIILVTIDRVADFIPAESQASAARLDAVALQVDAKVKPIEGNILGGEMKFVRREKLNKNNFRFAIRFKIKRLKVSFKSYSVVL